MTRIGTIEGPATLLALRPEAFSGPTAVELDHALGLLHLGDGAYDSAYAALHRACRGDGMPVAALVDLVEAAVRCGRRVEAERAATELERLVGEIEGALPTGLRARAAALLLRGSEAERRYIESIELLSEAGAELALARTRLLYGEWLRRQHRRRDARPHLKDALRVFEAQPSRAFVTRTLEELLASCEVARSRGVDTAGDLTARESQVARAAASGQTNKEIAVRLHVSPATVDYHLRKIFLKLGIESRRQLHTLALDPVDA